MEIKQLLEMKEGGGGALCVFHRQAMMEKRCLLQK